MSHHKDYSASLAIIRDIVTRRGWTLLTTLVEKSDDKIEIKCNRGHPINKRYSQICPGSDGAERLSRCPCPKCRFEDAETKFKDFVEAKRGRVIGKFTRVDMQTRIQCAGGHFWSPQPNTLYAGHWCSDCSGRSAEEAKIKFMRFLTEKGGRLMSEYVGNLQKMSIICNQGHIWQTTVKSINEGHWCQKCNGTHRETGRIKFYAVVEGNGGRVLGEYINARTKTPIQCREGHIWLCWPSQIANRILWCPECSQSHGEATVAKCLQNLRLPYQKEFALPEESRRPYDFITYWNQHIFIEYDGKQHFERINYFHPTVAIFEEHQQRDIDKTQAVINRGLRMIRLSYKVLPSELENIQNTLWTAIQRQEKLLYIDLINGQLVVSSQCENYTWLISKLQILAV